MVVFPKKNLGHAINIRYSSKDDNIEFVSEYGEVVDYFIDSKGQKVLWQKFDFGAMDQVFLYTYYKGIIEWGVCKKNK